MAKVKKFSVLSNNNICIIISGAVYILCAGGANHGNLCIFVTIFIHFCYNLYIFELIFTRCLGIVKYLCQRF